MLQLSVHHRRHGIMSSGVLFIFWFLFVIASIPQFRQEFRGAYDAKQDPWKHYQYISFMIFFAIIVMQSLASCFADRTPQYSEYAHIKLTKPSPEMSASFISRILFVWFDRMTWMGFRRPLTVQDMWDINPEDMSQVLAPTFDKNWQKNVKQNQTKNSIRTNVPTYFYFFLLFLF